ncbi:hypothetical protein C2E20_7154 [Micractinium conductrix]|uniref:Uncharacterized protein n=1 Tax=Micractinium conductrix TaxID=554055 RepID=A0A2P6V5L2_9CHLO|nr:hypothetical protein C2E20_7154 [Micractinium conductrix]|eukprot:PSC69357.1 hypothetical protein C2E20_7154 [Micractinium conductrix]
MPGAYLTEGGVHFAAALRMVADAAGFGEAVAASAAARGVSPDLPHPDTLQGLVWFGNGAAASFSMTLAAGGASIAVRAVGTQGAGEAVRGGLGAPPGSRDFRLTLQTAGEAAPDVETVSALGSVEAELASFARLVHTTPPPVGAPSLTLTPGEAGAAGATDGSDPERDAGGQASGGRRATGTGAGAAAAPPAPHHSVPDVREEGLGGEVHLTELPSMEDESRISAVEGIRDLALVAALLESAAAGGERAPVAQIA